MSQPARAAVVEPESRPEVLVVEDDLAMRRMIQEVLATSAADIVAVEGGQAALDRLENHDVAVVVTVLRLPRVGGLEVLEFAKRRNPTTQVILLTGHATVESAVDALKGEAFDYLRKPFEPEALRHVVSRALDFVRLHRENLALRERNREYSELDLLVGKSPAIEQVRRTVRTAAGYDCCVLITGESGTGKEVVAHQIHLLSGRRDKRFVALNCAAIPENVIESELFGHQKGAFTGADRARAGLFETADHGTLLLDEINNASPAFQAKLLRVLQDGTYYRLGENAERRSDVRVIAATNRPLPSLVESHEFRMDLYYRLRIVEIVMPPLRERRSDIPLLANYFILARQRARAGKPHPARLRSRERKRHSRERPAFRPGKPQPKRACHPRAGREAIPPGRRPCEGFPRRPGDAGPLRDRPARDRQRRKSSGAPRHFPGRVAFPRRYLHGSATRRSGKKGEGSGSFRREGPPGLIRT